MKEDFVLVALMVFSAVMLTYEWLSLYNNVNYAVIFFAFLLTLSLGILIIDLVIRMYRLMEELESTKRVIAMNSAEIEDRVDARLKEYLKSVESRIDTIERRIYR